MSNTYFDEFEVRRRFIICRKDLDYRRVRHTGLLPVR